MDLMDQSSQHIYNGILIRLAAVKRKENVVGTICGALFSGGVVLAAFLVAVLIEQAFYLDVVPRTSVFWLLVALGIGLVAWRVARPLFRLLHLLPDENDFVTARKVGKKFPHLNDRLVNIVQLFSEHANRALYSTELIDASLSDVHKEIESLSFTSIIDYAAPRRLGKLLAVTLGVYGLLLLIFPGTFLGSAFRLLNYDRSFVAPVAFTFIVNPGDKEVVKGETVPVLVRVEGEPQRQIILSNKPEGQVSYEVRKLDLAPDGNFKTEFRTLKSTTAYFVSAGSVRSREFTLRVVDRPVVKTLRLVLRFPGYARLPAKQLDDNIGDVTALKGTRVNFYIEANKELSLAHLVFNDGSQLALTVSGDHGSGNTLLMKECTYHVMLKDTGGLATTEPIEYAMKVLPDGYPTVSILVPGRNVDITENIELQMLVKIKDDYGFTKLRLAHRLVQSRYEQPAQGFSYIDFPLPGGTQTEFMVPFRWSLKNLSLVPEDVVSYYAEVFDNDNVSGPKSALSEIFTLRLPSLEEVFADVDKGHEVSLEGMKEAMKQAEAAKRDLDELQLEMKKGQQKMDWQDRKKADETLKKYQEIQKKLEEVNKTVEEMVDEIQKNRILSKETLEKYQELQQLMQQMNSPEFAEAMKKLQQALQQMDPNQMRQALQQFTFSEENFRKSVERTINLLRRIQIEQKVEEVLKRANQLMKQQEQLQEETKQTDSQNSKRLKELAEQQKQLQEQLQRLKEQLRDLQSKMNEFPTEMPLAEMQKAMDFLEQSGLNEQMQQIAQQMQQQQIQQALQGQKQAMQEMGQFVQQLQNMQQALRQNQQRQIVNEMRKALYDLLELSKRQEVLKNESQHMEPNSQHFRENAEEQMAVMKDLANVANGMSRLSQKTFGITPEMGKSIGDALRRMNDAMQALEQRNGNTAGQQQGGAMASLNEAAQQVQSAMDAMMQGSEQGMGMAGFMQRLQQMTGMQQSINQGTQNLGGMSPEQAAEMARLAGEQGMVRKSLEQLAKEAANAGQLSKMLGDLNRVAQDMREVQMDLAQGNVNPETLRKQERILSRLLDSQRSARERDYEKTRRAESGRDVLKQSPAQIDLTSQEGRNRLRQDLLKAMEEGYSRDYQELIRKYFEALEESERQRQSQ